MEITLIHGEDPPLCQTVRCIKQTLVTLSLALPNPLSPLWVTGTPTDPQTPEGGHTITSFQDQTSGPRAVEAAHLMVTDIAHPCSPMSIGDKVVSSLIRLEYPCSMRLRQAQAPWAKNTAATNNSRQAFQQCCAWSSHLESPCLHAGSRNPILTTGSDRLIPVGRSTVLMAKRRNCQKVGSSKNESPNE